MIVSFFNVSVTSSRNSAYWYLKRGQFTIFTIYLELGYNGLLPLCKIQHLTKQLRTGDVLHDPRMIDVLDHHGEGFDGGLLDVDDILRSSKRTKELSPEDRADRC